MADTKDTIRQPGNPNQTMQHEKAKAEVSGKRQDERDRLDQQRHQQRQEKGAIGGGQTASRTGEPGRARNELDTDDRKEPASRQR